MSYFRRVVMATAFIASVAVYMLIVQSGGSFFIRLLASIPVMSVAVIILVGLTSHGGLRVRLMPDPDAPLSWKLDSKSPNFDYRWSADAGGGQQYVIIPVESVTDDRNEYYAELESVREVGRFTSASAAMMACECDRTDEGATP